MSVIDPFNKEELVKLADDPRWVEFYSSKFTEALEKFGPTPEVTYDFERNVWEI